MLVKYFKGSDQFPIEGYSSYLQDLANRGKAKIYDKRFSLRDFCGYIGETLYIPEKIDSLLKLDSDSYKRIFTNLFGEVLYYFDDETLYQLFPTRFGLNEYTLNSSLIFQLNTVLKNRDSIEYSLYLISRQPFRALQEKRYCDEFSRVSRVDESIIEDIIHNPQSWFENDYRKPLKVLQYRNSETINTIENSFVKYFLQELLTILEKLIVFTEDTPIQRLQVISLRDRVEEVYSSMPFQDIDDMTLFPYNSQVLLKRDGYRELFEIYNQLYLSRKPTLFNTLENAISLKDISTVWEYYLFVQIIRYFGPVRKQRVDSNRKIEKEVFDRVYMEFESGVRLSYQATFLSYTKIKFRPDFYITVNGKNIILDAKFRAFEPNRTDILKNMHHYRDGLGVDSAIAITIGDRDSGTVYNRDSSEVEISSLSDLFKVESGVGYLSLNLNRLKESR
jgi:predicted component of viral defense system (DUF524 family)